MEIPCNMKTINQTELARLAATLARDGDDATLLCRRAYELWEASGKELVYQKARAVMQQKCEREQRERQRQQPIPMPGRYPVNLKTFLRLVLPNVKHNDAVHKYRAFLTRWTPTGWEPSPEGPQDYGPAIIDGLKDETKLDKKGHPRIVKRKGFNAGEDRREAQQFRRWVNEQAAQTRKAKAQDGAEARWKKGLEARRGSANRH